MQETNFDAIQMKKSHIRCVYLIYRMCAEAQTNTHTQTHTQIQAQTDTHIQAFTHLKQ